MIKILTTFICLIFILGCGPKIIFEKKITLDMQQWKKETTLSFPFNAVDTSGLYDLILEVKTDDNFHYQNLYVNIETSFPEGEKVSDVVSLELSNGAGRSNGKCSGNHCITPIALQTNIKFRKQGMHQFSIKQYSREAVVNGVNSLTFKVVESVRNSAK